MLGKNDRVAQKNQLCFHRHNSTNTEPNDLIETRQKSEEPQPSGNIKYVSIHEGEVFLMLKL